MVFYVFSPPNLGSEGLLYSINILTLLYTKNICFVYNSVSIFIEYNNPQKCR